MVYQAKLDNLLTRLGISIAVLLELAAVPAETFLCDRDKFDGHAKRRNMHLFVIPAPDSCLPGQAPAGIQEIQGVKISLDPGFHRGDDFLHNRQTWQCQVSLCDCD